MENEVHISLDEIVAFLKRGSLVAFAATIVAAAATYVYRSEVPPTFEATTTLYAADAVLDMRSVGLSYLVSPTLHVNAYRSAALSEPVLADTLRVLGVLDVSADRMADVDSRLTIRTDADSRLITIAARAPAASEAASLANAVAASLVKWDAERPRGNLVRMIEGLEERIAVLDQQISAAQSTDAAGGGAQADSLVALRSEQLAQLATAVMLSDSVIGRLEAVRPAIPPLAPVSPSPLFEAVLAGLLAFGLAYLVQLLARLADRRIRDVRQMARISGLPILASFGGVARPPRRLPAGPINFLRTSLSPSEDGRKVILLTGFDGGPMTTQIACGLSESFARAGYATLLVGAGTHNDRLARRYDLLKSDTTSLESHLRNASAARLMKPTPIEHNAVIHVLTGRGPSEESSELLAQGFRRALECWNQDFQIIIVDAPPVLSFADALTIAPHCDAVVLVANRKLVDRAQLVTAIEMLQQRSAPIAGLAVTHAATSQRGPRSFDLTLTAPSHEAAPAGR